MDKLCWEEARSSVELSCLWSRTLLRLKSCPEFATPTLVQGLEWCVRTSGHLSFCEAWNMTTSSHACPVPAVSGHMTHYPAAPYPLLFPPVIGGLSLPPLHGLHGHPPPSGCSTPSPASKYPWNVLSFLLVDWFNGPEKARWLISRVSFHSFGCWFLLDWNYTFSAIGRNVKPDKWWILEFGPFKIMLTFCSIL